MDTENATSRPRISKGFQVEVYGALGRIEAQQVATNDHLKTLNGRTGKNEDRLTRLEMDLAQRAGQEKERKQWSDKLWPFVKAAVLIAGGVALAHGPKLLEQIQKVMKGIE